MRIALLGPFTVHDDAERAVRSGGAKQRAVLAQLCHEPNRAVGIDRLAEGLWGEQVPTRYRQNIQVYVSNWRRALDADRPVGAPGRIIGHRDAYELLAAPAEGRPEFAATELAKGLAEWRGDPLADLSDQPFAAEWISALETERMDALEARIQADLDRGQDSGLSSELETLLRRYPERERLWQHLALSLYRAGRQADALAALDRARDHLLDELGLDPSPQLRQLHTQILQQDRRLLAAAPVTVKAPLPVPLAECIGRSAVVHDVLRLIDAGERLLTLIGPGGAGKTRLGLEIGHALAAAARPVIWVPLADEREVDAITGRLLAAAGLGRIDELGAVVAERRPLVILDNLEHLAGAGTVLRPLLETFPDLQLLTTSRSPLRIPGERLVPLPQLDESDLVTLFIDHARLSAPGVDLSHRHDEVLGICRLLDGLPLAVELVAAQIQAYDLTDLATDLSSGQDPSDGTADGSRHSSLRRAVRWSVELLPAADQLGFARLSVLTGTFDRATAVAVAGAAHRIDRFVNSSLVQPVETEAGRRFTLLGTIRAAAAALLDDDTEALDLLTSHLLSRAAAVDLGAETVPRAAVAAAEDLPNTEMIVARLVADGRGADAALITVAAFRPMIQLSRRHDLLRLARTVLDSGLTGEWRARVGVVAGAAAYSSGDPAAPALLDSVTSIADDDLPLRVIGHNFRCVFRADIGDAAGAASDADRGLAAARSSGRAQLMAGALSAASWAAIRRGDFGAAVEFAAEQKDHVDNAAGLAAYWNDLCLAQLFAADIAGAEASADQGMALGYQVGMAKHLNQAMKLMASVRLHQGDGLAALSLLAAATSRIEPQTDPGWLMETVAQIGLGLLLLGDSAHGPDLLRRSALHAYEYAGADSAVPDFDRSVADNLGVRLAAPSGPPSESLDDLVAESQELARSAAALPLR